MNTGTKPISLSEHLPSLFHFPSVVGAKDRWWYSSSGRLHPDRAKAQFNHARLRPCHCQPTSSAHCPQMDVMSAKAAPRTKRAWPRDLELLEEQTAAAQSMPVGKGTRC